MNKKRVVITGLGVVAPNAIGVDEFAKALFDGKSGIKFWQESMDLNFRCQIGGEPALSAESLEKRLPLFYREGLSNKAILYACQAGMEAAEMAGIKPNTDLVENAGVVMGAGSLGLDSFIKPHIDQVNEGQNRKLGSRIVTQCMNSGAVSYLNQLLGFGGPIMSNSSACITGSEALLMGYEQIQLGKADIMLCGSTEGTGRFIWGAFDTIRVLCSNSNENPEFGSRPMSDSSAGFVPSGGSGVVILETLESAQARGANILAELAGGHQNSGGMRNGGSMTAQNPEAAVSCIKKAVKNSEVDPKEIDLISGHLTSTKGDPAEIKFWMDGLELSGEGFPSINTPKSMIGHCIAGAGSIESVACILQLSRGFVHKNINITSETIHPGIKAMIPEEKIVTKSREQKLNVIIKSNFGFGDLNCCLVFKSFTE